MKFLGGILLVVALASMAIPSDSSSIENDMEDHVVEVIAKLSANPARDPSYDCSRSCLTVAVNDGFNSAVQAFTLNRRAPFRFQRIRSDAPFLPPFPQGMPFPEQWLIVTDWIRKMRPIYRDFERCLGQSPSGELKDILIELTKPFKFFYVHDDFLVEAAECVEDGLKLHDRIITDRIVNCSNNPGSDYFNNTTAPSGTIQDFVRESAQFLCEFEACVKRSLRPILLEECGLKNTKLIGGMTEMVYRATLFFVTKYHQMPENLECSNLVRP